MQVFEDAHMMQPEDVAPLLYGPINLHSNGYPHFCTKYIFKWSNIHCYLSLLECTIRIIWYPIRVSAAPLRIDGTKVRRCVFKEKVP